MEDFHRPSKRFRSATASTSEGLDAIDFPQDLLFDPSLDTDYSGHHAGDALSSNTASYIFKYDHTIEPQSWSANNPFGSIRGLQNSADSYLEVIKRRA